MAQYIDKFALLEYLNQLYEKHSTPNSVDEGGVVINDIEYFIDTLEVKEVDINKEISQFIDANFEKATIGHKLSLRRTAKHFFELGLKANQVDEVKIGETRIYLNDDGGEPPYDGKQWLDLSCVEYEIPSNKFKDGDNVEIIIRKTQKGE